MPTSQDLMGLGVPGMLAEEIGNSPQSIAGAGTTQATAAAIRTQLALVTASGGATGAILPSDALIGSPYYVISVSGTPAVIYAPVGQTVNCVTSATGHTFSGASGMQIFLRVSSTAWFSTGITTIT